MAESSLHSLNTMHGRKLFNRVFAAVYALAIIALFYHHALTLTAVPLSIFMLISDFILAIMWFTSQSFFMNPVTRQQFPENLEKWIDKSDFPAIDIFICTADPFKEPPLTTVNTALSVLAYDYPAEKLSVYVSDDGGSKLILFALTEAANFAKNWLPYCREYKIEQRCPEDYFRRNHTPTSQFQIIENLYEDMKTRIKNVVERNDEVLEECITDPKQREAFSKWTKGFTPKDHPAIIQVLLESDKDKDVKGYSIPNLIYVSREKSTASLHHFKAGALNALLRVSKVMTNAPLILTLDCDMYSNYPQTPQRILCYFCDPLIKCKLGFVQFPQRYHGLNEDDIYGGDNARIFRILPSGLDGLGGPDNCGTGCFFNRRAFFGSPSSVTSLAHSEDGHTRNMAISSVSVVELACHAISCNYEYNTDWGSKIGIKYGTLVEDIYTGYMMQCEGWNSIFCNPERPAFLGEVPINLNDVLSQVKRWSFGHLEVLSCKYSPLTFGTKALGLLRANCYIHYVLWPIWCIPVTLYACIPQLTLLNNISIFPKVFDPWFFLYVFLFFGANAHDFVQFILFKGTAKRWWNDQRMWYVKALSPYLFTSIEYLMKRLGIMTKGFNITSKVAGQDERKMYDQSVFTFEIPSPMFVPLVTVSIINLMAFLKGIMTMIFRMESLDEFFIQLFVVGFIVSNCLPIYEAMLLRYDHGRMPKRIVTTSVVLVGVLCIAFSLFVS